jgi:superoxide dismutase, Fe-Mn family
MAFTLPALPYAFNALEPHIDARTMEIHHGKHHQTYVNNLNAALEAHPDLQNKSIEELISSLDSLPEAIRTAVRNNGGGHANHTLFWEIMAPGGNSDISAELQSAIDSAFGSLDGLKEAVNKAGAGRFGSGWAWVVVEKGGGLTVTSTPNQDTPVMEGKTPILGVDVWEHAYYLNYQNRRPDYLKAWWNVVNWAEVSRRYAAGK